jgi:hypothetical protein
MLHLPLLFLLLPIYALILCYVGRREIKALGRLSLGYKIQAVTIFFMSCFVPALMSAIFGYGQFEKWFGWLFLPIIVLALVWFKPNKEKQNET